MKPILEQIPLGTHKSISAFRFHKDHFETPWHFHPQHELTLIEGSVGTKFVGDYVGPYSPGELVLLRSKLPHCWKNHSLSGGSAKSTVIQWNPGIFAQVPEIMPVFELMKRASRGILFDSAEIAPYLPAILNFPKLEGHTLYIGLLEVLTQLSKCPYRYLSEARFLEDIPDEFNTRMSSIHEFISTEYARKIYLQELADLVNMTEQSFSRFFRKMMGRPFFTFLNEYRINMASRMLIDTDKSVAEIAYACGYESLPFFHKQFKKFQQETPMGYRKGYQR